MNTHRVTISFPKHLYDRLAKQIPQGKVSLFVSQAVEKELLSNQGNPIDDFLDLRKKMPKVSEDVISKAIKIDRL